MLSRSVVSNSATPWTVPANSTVHGILQARILEWVAAISFSTETITTDKASGGDGIPAELFQILKDDDVKVLHSICQRIWKTQQ